MSFSVTTIKAFFRPRLGVFGSYFTWILVAGSLFLAISEYCPNSTSASDSVTPDASRDEESIIKEESIANKSATPSRLVDEPSDLASNLEATNKESSKQELDEWLSLISDNSLELHKREMPAYWRLISLAKDETFSSLTERARKSPAFTEFYLAAPKHRGELVSLDVNIRRVMKYPVNEGSPDRVQNLYEIWGWTNQAKSWLYVFVTPELPEGMNESTLVNQSATFTGYFLKLQGYHSGMARQNNQPLVAPLLIGKFGYVKASQVQKAKLSLRVYFIVLSVLGICGLSFVTKYLLTRNHNGLRGRKTSARDRSVDLEEKFDWMDLVETESNNSSIRQ